MKRKHSHEGPQIKVIADAKKLAWLKGEIEKRKARAAMKDALKRSVANSQ